MLVILIDRSSGRLEQLAELRQGPQDLLDLFFPQKTDPGRQSFEALAVDEKRLAPRLAHKLVGRCAVQDGVIRVDPRERLEALLERDARRAHEARLLELAKEIALLRLEGEVLGGLPDWARDLRGHLMNELAAMQRTGPPVVAIDDEVLAVAGSEIPLVCGCVSNQERG